MKLLSYMILMTTLLCGGGLTAKASSTISALDSEQFEQSYETWIKQIIAGIDPSLKFTVLTQIDFTQNPQQLADFEELQSLRHLPGLPEVSDPHYENPLESPLVALVDKKRVKIILYSALNSRKEAIIREVLDAKLKLKGTDSLNFESIEGNASAPAPRSPNLKILGYLCLMMSAGLFAFVGVRLNLFKFKFKNKTAAANTEAPIFSNAHVAQQIESAPRLALRKALSSEPIERVGRASLNATEKFSNLILGECEQERFDQVMQWIRDNRKNVNHHDSNFARLLISAKIQQVSSETVLSSIEKFNQIQQLKLKVNRPMKMKKNNKINEVQL